MWIIYNLVTKLALTVSFQHTESDGDNTSEHLVDRKQGEQLSVKRLSVQKNITDESITDQSRKCREEQQEAKTPGDDETIPLLPLV